MAPKDLVKVSDYQAAESSEMAAVKAQKIT